jgi:hypothetical protein
VDAEEAVVIIVVTARADSLSTLDEVYTELQKEDVKISDKYHYSHPIKTKNKTVSLSLGRIWFNLLLPDDYTLIDEPVTKKVISKIMLDIINKYESDKISEIFSNLQKHIFKITAIHPVTLSINEFILPDDIKKKKENLAQYSDDIVKFQEESSKISSDYLAHIKDSGIDKMIKSGSKGSVNDLNAFVIAKGPTIDIEDNVSKPIISSINDGFTPEEYYIAAKEARRLCYIKAKGTAEPGYLARRIVFANCNTTIGSKDCKTNKYLTIAVDDKLFNRLQGRFYLNEDTNKLEEITPDTKIVGKTIKLRSPLYCKEKGDKICQTCYGKLYERLNTKYIGIFASSILNKVGVEYFSMKAKHKATQVSISEVDFTKDLLK